LEFNSRSRSLAAPRVVSVKLTSGQVCPDGTIIELVRYGNSASSNLLLWHSGEQACGGTVEYRGEQYQPSPISESVLHELHFPPGVGPYGSVRELIAEVCQLINQLVSLPEKGTTLIGRFILASWLIDAMPIAPRRRIEGPDRVRACQLLEFLYCACRRALRLGALTPAGFYSLPSGMRFTVLLHQPSRSAQLVTTLKTTAIRNSAVLRNGELLDLYGAQAILCEGGFDGDEWVGSIRIPCLPGGSPLPILGPEQQRRLVDDLQPKLLAFRFSNYQTALVTTFDVSKFAAPLQDISTSLAAATPGDADLQEVLHALLPDENSEIEAAGWVDADVVILEAILVLCREGKLKSAYMIKDIAEMANGILAGRGEDRRLDADDVGRRIRDLGFSKQPRDERGVRLRFSSDACDRAHALGHRFNVPGIRDCECRPVGDVGNVGDVGISVSAAELR
jgi:hypothetical protein